MSTMATFTDVMSVRTIRHLKNISHKPMHARTHLMIMTFAQYLEISILNTSLLIFALSVALDPHIEPRKRF